MDHVATGSATSRNDIMSREDTMSRTETTDRERRTAPARPRRRWLPVSLAAALTLAAACGSDADDAGTGVTTGDETVDSALDEAQDDVEAAAEDASETVDSALDEAEEQVDDVDAADAEAAAEDLAETLLANGLSSLASLVEQVDLNAIVGDGEFTLFAPNDDAFLQLDADTAADLASDPTLLGDVLQNHVVSERLEAADLAETTTVDTAGGATLSVDQSGDTVTVGGADVVTTDLEVANGVIHVIDEVLTP